MLLLNPNPIRNFRSGKTIEAFITAQLSDSAKKMVLSVGNLELDLGDGELTMLPDNGAISIVSRVIADEELFRFQRQSEPGVILKPEDQMQITGELDDSIKFVCGADSAPELGDSQTCSIANTSEITLTATAKTSDSEALICFKNAPPKIYTRIIGPDDSGEFHQALSFAETSEMEIRFFRSYEHDFAHIKLKPNAACTIDSAVQAVMYCARFLSGGQAQVRASAIVKGEAEIAKLSSGQLAAVDHPEPITLTELDESEREQLLSCLITYFLSKEKSPIPFFLVLCWEMTSRQYTSKALTVAVAIEGIATSLVKNKQNHQPIFKALYDEIMTCLPTLSANLPGSTEERKVAMERVRALLSRGFELTGKALIKKAFDELGCDASKDELDQWRDARNSIAHGSFKSELSQAALDRYFCCVALLHRLVLTDAGYRGSYVNYAKLGWPDEPIPARQPVLTPDGTQK